MLKKTILFLAFGYIIYSLFFSVSIFRIHAPAFNKDEYVYVTNQLDATETNKQPKDRVILLEDGLHAGIARIGIIEQAEKTIDIAYYTLHKGSATNTFLGLLLDAADRGVQVNILLDGIFHNLRGELKNVIYSFASHPNVELKFYEPLHLMKPWTWNNRLHDKLMIIDEKYAMIGGRNIGNKYFMKEEKAFVEDRDVLIINQHSNSSHPGVIDDMESYFQELWAHDFVKKPVEKISKKRERKGKNKSKQLLKELKKRKLKHPDVFDNPIDWSIKSIPVEQITFIHNPITRLNKDPWVWLEINNLMKNAKNSIKIESPYVVPTKMMMEYTDHVSIPRENMTIITNSLTTTPNPLAFSGYLRHVDKIIEKGLNLQEYVGSHSIHGKTYLIDHHISVIGSFNLDSRSTFLSTESMVVIESQEFASHLHDHMMSKTKQNQKDGISNVKSDDEFESTLAIKKLLLKVLSKITAFYHHML